MVENRVLRGVFAPKREEVTGTGENCLLRSVMIYTSHQIFG
jgi:hypothetical protein